MTIYLINYFKNLSVYFYCSFNIEYFPTSPLIRYYTSQFLKNGYEATKEIKEEENFYGIYIPIIALTAHTQGSEEANKTFKAGMDACLCKPLKDKDLLEAVKQIDAKNE